MKYDFTDKTANFIHKAQKEILTRPYIKGKKYQVFKRTFDAKKFNPDTPQNKALNEHILTSEYLPQYKFVIFSTIGTFLKSTKAECDEITKNFV